MRAAALIFAAVAATASCELREVTAASAEDVIIAEVILRAGERVQTAWLHRTATVPGSAEVPDATILVRAVDGGESFTYTADADSLCLSPAPPPGLASTGTCYVARGSTPLVRAGARYTVRVGIRDGRVLTGATTVPGDFTVLTPAAPSCTLAPATTVELTWTRSAGASVYIVGARMNGLRAALKAGGVPVPAGDDIDFIGLSVTGSDTTLVFPAEIGLFSRFDDELHPVLLAIRSGLPPGVEVDLGIAAADRNYVNWVRGGNFNPSGLVRISSLQGDGHGVFGSENVRRARMRTYAVPGDVACR